MKILAIRIKNLASLEGTTIIDFKQEPLCSAGIFAITGPTGAGKSTILDALCLALYAKTPRYEKANDPKQNIQDVSGALVTQSDPRKILRDGAAEGYAEVDFVGVDGHKYRAQWSVRRARNKADGALQEYLVSCKNLDNLTDIQGKKSEVLAAISNKIGLSFDQFTRAVLLAQGDFTAFLKAPTSEKSELLEKLTGTHIYSEISKRVFERHRSENEQLKILNTQKEAISVMNEDEEATLKNRQDELTKQREEQKNKEEILFKEYTWHEKLQNLKQTLHESNQAYELALSQKNEAYGRELKLNQIELVQEARIFVDGLKTQEKLLEEKELKLKILETELVQKREHHITHSALLNEARQISDSKIREQQDAQPLLNKAKKLDASIEESGKQLKKSDLELLEATSLFSEQRKRVINLKEQKKLLSESVEAASAFAEKNQDRKLLAENDKLIINSLSDAQISLQEMEQIVQDKNNIQERLKHKQADEGILKKKLDDYKESEKKVLAEYERLLEEFKSVDEKAIQESKKHVDGRILEFTQASANWQILSEATASYEKDVLNLEKKQLDLQHHRLEFQQATIELARLESTKKAAYRSLEIATQETSENVVSLRHHLKKDHPCPVCGSIEHPYVSHNPQVGKILEQLSAEYHQQEEAYLQSLAVKSALEEKVNQLERDIKILYDTQIKRVQELQNYRGKWALFSQHSEAENRSQEDVAKWLKDQLIQNEKQQQLLQKQIEQWQEHQLGVERQKNQYEDIIEKLRKSEDELKDLRRTIESLNDELVRLDKNYTAVKLKLSKTQQSLNAYFNEVDWFEKWEADSATFTDDIRKFASAWKTNNENLNKAIQDQRLLDATIQSEEGKSELFNNDVKKKKEVHQSLTENYNDLLKQRNQLFEGRATDKVEQALKSAIELAGKSLEQNQKKLEEINQNITRIITQQEETSKEIQRIKKEKQSLNDDINHFLQKFNSQQIPAITRTDMEALLNLPSDWVKTEKKNLQLINDSLLQAKTIYQKIQKDLENHLQLSLSEKSMETVAELLEDVRQLLQQTNQELTEIGVRLKQNDINRKKAGALLQQIATKESIVNNWDMLNQVIGSADGKKFRQVAQEYTLDVLLGYTNVQLQMLSKRYVLQRIPKSLGLQVLDQEMGNEVRTVNSLSGGESFLVSLALALGLASLSSSRMQVESLFIDEGFGSLDLNTLNVAMDALERLQNQGRKVGVISHVQEMTERIPVQIRVSKQQNGRSIVEAS